MFLNGITRWLRSWKNCFSLTTAFISSGQPLAENAPFPGFSVNIIAFVFQQIDEN